MISHSLSEREKQAIDAILAQAEEEFLQPTSSSIEKIDDQCRSLWPDWDPNSIRNKHENIDDQLKSDCAYDTSKQLLPQVTFDILPNNQLENRNDARDQPNDMNVLRKEVQNLMSRINQTVDVDEIPIDSDLTSSSNKRPTKKKKQTQPIHIEDDDKSESTREESISKKKKKTKKNSAISSTCSTPPDSSEVQQSSIVRPKSKIQAKQVIASTSRQMKVIESENKMLKQRLAEMEISFNEAQKEIRSLKEALRKSEAIRSKLTNSSNGGTNDSKPIRPRKKLEYVNRF